MRVVGRALALLLAASSRAAACAGCRVVPVERSGATCSPTCWSARHP